MNDTAREEARALLTRLVGKTPLRFVARGNEAIRQALTEAKRKGRTELLAPDQGGWLTYETIGKKLGFRVERFATKDGVFGPESIIGGQETAVLFNSMPAYAFTIDMQSIAEHCEKRGILLINDATATIGTSAGAIGDLIIGSLGKWKPLPLGAGGFIAGLDTDEEEPAIDYERLVTLLRTLHGRAAKIRALAKELKARLPREALIHSTHEGYNAIAAYETEQEKETLINTARGFDDRIEHTLCPRTIRVERKAVCFEVKRLFSREV